MRYSLLAASLLLSSMAQADLLDALKYYKQQDFAKARIEFSQLVPLGNEMAAFNLAAMYHNGEGTEADPVKALAYFQLAGELGDPRAAGITQKLSQKLSAEQRAQAQGLTSELLAAIEIKEQSKDAAGKVDLPKVISRKEPQYPEAAARAGVFGYTVMRFVIDEAGNVPVVEVLGSYPDDTFDKTSIRALKQWKYEATGQKHQAKVVLHYSLGPVSKMGVGRVMEKHKLMENAVAGSPSHQYVLGTLLDLLATNSSYSVSVNKALPLNPDAELPVQFFQDKRYLNLTALLEGFHGGAEVKTDEQGYITQVLSASPMELEQATALLKGKLLRKNASFGHYKLWADPGKKATAEPVLELSQMHSSGYWWRMAAKNGNIEAQRQLAAFSPQWENYLLKQNDPQVQTWSGVREILQGNKAAGLLLLDKAIAQNYATAAELKAAL